MDGKNLDPSTLDINAFFTGGSLGPEATAPAPLPLLTPRKSKRMRTSGGIAHECLMTAPYAVDKRAYMELINEVRATGVSAHVNLPTICVCGNESSGKSSLIEAISGINLPRAAGTCTRCPTEVRLQETPDMPWQCKIKLRREVDEDGNAWTGEKEVAFGLPISNPSMVEYAIRRAQLAILNPSVDFKRFIDYQLPKEPEKKPLGSKKELSFSQNVVCLEISGPQVTDLTLIDLPGLIKNHEVPGSPELVEALVRSYVSRDCLILLTVTMLDNTNNQLAFRIAKEYDPKGRRTIGVLTKADRVQVADAPDWIKMLRGQREYLHHGYFVTRQPGTEELDAKITFEEARKKETAFFANSEPWKDLDHALRQRLGTKALTAFLSNQLTSLIKQKLPGLLKDIDSASEAVEQALRKMPARPSDDPSAEMLRLLTTFQAEVMGYTKGDFDQKPLVQEILAIYTYFKSEIKATRPLFIPFTKTELSEKNQKGTAEDCLSLLMEDAAEEAALSDNTAVARDSQVMEGQEPTAVTRQATTLDEVRIQIERALAWELPGNVPWDMKKKQIAKVTRPWRRIILDIFEEVKPVVRRSLQRLVVKSFGRYEETMLTATIQSYVDEQISKLADSTRTALEHAILLETELYTQNDHYLSSVCEKAFATLSERRSSPIASNLYNRKTLVSDALSSLSRLGINVKEDELKKLTSSDEWEREIRVMAEIRAYFQVAYKRIIDTVPLTITVKFIRPLSSTIYDALLEHLAISSPEGRERCKAYLSESPDVTAQRSQLEEQRKNLKAAQEAVHRFKNPIAK